MLKYIVIPILFLFSSNVYAEYFQYATLTQVEYNATGNKYGILLSYSTDPGYPITIMVDEGGIINGKKEAYLQLFERAGWGIPDEYDLVYILNVLGSQGWEVINYKEKEELVFTNRYPGTKKEFLLKRVLEKPTKALQPATKRDG